MSTSVNVNYSIRLIAHLLLPRPYVKRYTECIDYLYWQIKAIYEECGRPASIVQFFSKDMIYNKFVKARLQKGTTGNTLVVYIYSLLDFSKYVRHNCSPNKKVTGDKFFDIVQSIH